MGRKWSEDRLSGERRSAKQLIGERNVCYGINILPTLLTAFTIAHSMWVIATDWFKSMGILWSVQMVLIGGQKMVACIFVNSLSVITIGLFKSMFIPWYLRMVFTMQRIMVLITARFFFQKAVFIGGIMRVLAL